MKRRDSFPWRWEMPPGYPRIKELLEESWLMNPQGVSVFSWPPPQGKRDEVFPRPYRFNSALWRSFLIISLTDNP